jgi:hypothetical protein
MAIAKKSIVGKASAKHSTKKTAAAKAASPVTPAKMVPATRLAKAQLLTTKTSMQTGMMTRW